MVGLPLTDEFVWITVTIYSAFFALLIYRGIPGREDWKRRGSLVAFIIALYAEMWGFPLSLFVVTSLTGTSQLPYQFDNLAYFFSQPRTQGDDPFHNPALAFRFEYVLARALTLLAIFPIIYGWNSLMRNRDETIVRNGPYRFCRHPQYVGFILFVVGMTLYWPTLLTVPMGVTLCCAYYALAVREERELSKLSPAYRKYMAEAPRFIGRSFFQIFRLPSDLSLPQALAVLALILPFAIWFGEGFTAWVLGYEQLVREFWFPIAYALPVHIGLVFSAVILGIAALVARVHNGFRLGKLGA